MEFQINVTKFMQALSPVIDVATKNTIKDFDSAFMISISAYKDELVLLSHCGNACLQKSLSNANTDKLSYECDDEWEAVVEAKKLMVTLSSFPPNKNVKNSCPKVIHLMLLNLSLSSFKYNSAPAANAINASDTSFIKCNLDIDSFGMSLSIKGPEKIPINRSPVIIGSFIFGKYTAILPAATATIKNPTTIRNNSKYSLIKIQTDDYYFLKIEI